MAKKSTYNAKDIEVLEGLEPVRKRPGMYIGSTNQDGLHHLVNEVLDNSIDEVLAGHATDISFQYKKDGSIKIKDNGIGIEEKHLPKITDRFYRVDKARSKNSNSSGLGLSIVKSLVEKNNGKLKIYSDFGKGTEVCLYLISFIK